MKRLKSKRRKTAKTKAAKTKAARTAIKIKSVRGKPAGKHSASGARARRAPVNKRHDDYIEALMAAGAQALGLAIDPAWRDAVKFHLRLVLDHAARVDEFPLPDDAEPAPVFHA